MRPSSLALTAATVLSPLANGHPTPTAKSLAVSRDATFDGSAKSGVTPTWTPSAHTVSPQSLANQPDDASSEDPFNQASDEGVWNKRRGTVITFERSPGGVEETQPFQDPANLFGYPTEDDQPEASEGLSLLDKGYILGGVFVGTVVSIFGVNAYDRKHPGKIRNALSTVWNAPKSMCSRARLGRTKATEQSVALDDFIPLSPSWSQDTAVGTPDAPPPAYVR